MKNWKAKLATEKQTQAEVKIQRGIFLPPFVIAMVPFNYLLRKYIGGYKFTKSQ